ncbi:uncharacterized protein LOC124366599 [Homalodisca vitripennis]|uniref:uncharacterized protein LOC124366599 n=1 Tax=Homalodisca vitripennis TaxID=197043 RepID=UPI001EEC461B|nr:uncharacterized protein LOC124366599 [Homalodisca vitripennis]
MKLCLHSFFVAILGLLTLLAVTYGHPVSNADAIVENMRQIPQWHCLRYRKFDLVKRCRNYRVMMRRQ